MPFAERPKFYPLIRMPTVHFPIPGNVCPQPRPFMPPSPPLQSFQSFNMSSPMDLPLRPFPPPPPPQPNMVNQRNPISIPPRPCPPPVMQDLFTPPSSAPCTPKPILGLPQQNDILTQRWQWLPSMLCSIADDPSGDVYKIASITWNGFEKDCYLKKQENGHDQLPLVEKDIFERDLVPVMRHAPPPPRQLTPPLERQWGPAPPESGFNREATTQIPRHEGGISPPIPIIRHINESGSASQKYDGDNGQRDCLGPKSPHVEDFGDDEEEDYESMPPLSPAMAQRGIFPAEETYYSSHSQSSESHYDEFNDQDSSFRRDEGYAGSEPEFVTLGSPMRAFDAPSPKHKKSHGERRKKKHHRVKDEQTERSDRSDSDRSSKRSSKSSKSKRSRRSSSSSEEGKAEKESSHSHRPRPSHRKPSLFGF